MTQLFYQNAEGQQSGPIDSKELRRLATAGIVKQDTLLRQSGSTNWVPAERVTGLFNQTTPRSNSESNSKLGHATRYLFAIAACGFELVAYASICDFTGWNRTGFIGLFPLLIFLALWRATWVAITKTDNNGSEPTLKASTAHEASTSYEVEPTELGKAVSEQVVEKASGETLSSTSTTGRPSPSAVSHRVAFVKRQEFLELAAFFALVGSLMLLGVFFQGIITPTHMDKHLDLVGSLGDTREKQIRDEVMQSVAGGGRYSKMLAEFNIDDQLAKRAAQRKATEQAEPEIAETVRDLLSNLGNRSKVLGVVRKLAPKQREEALRVAPGVGQHMGDDRADFFTRCIAAFSRGVTHGWVNPLMELVGIGGTENEIQFIRQLDKIAAQEFHPYRPGDPWSESVLLQAIEMLPWLFVIGGSIFIAHRWKSRSGMKYAHAPNT